MTSGGGASRPESLFVRLTAQYLSILWVRLLSFLTIAFIGPKFLEKYELAALILALTAFEVAALFSDCGFHHRASAVMSGDRDEGVRVLRQGLVFRLSMFVVCALVVALFYFRQVELPYRILLLFCLSLLPYAWVQNARAYWNSRRRIGPLQLASAAAYTLGYIATAIFAISGLGVVYVAAALAAAFWIEWVLTVWWCRPDSELSADISFYGFALPKFENFMPGLKKSLPYGMFSIAWLVYLRLDIFLVRGVEPDALAEYGIALKFYSFTLMILQGGALVILSDSGGIREKLKAMPGRSGLLAVALGMWALAIWLAPTLLVLILPEGYSGIVSPTRVLMCAGTFHAAGLVMGLLALGDSGRAGRALWWVYAMGAGIIILLACLEPLLVANVYWEYNRLLADIIILLAVVVVNVRYRAAADTLRKQDDSRFLDTAE